MELRKNDFFHITAFALLGLTVVSLTGCYSSITAREVTDDPKTAGLRYFLPSPYLVIRQMPNDTWDAELQVFVDRSRTFSVQPNAYLAKSNFTLVTGADGTIKSFTLTQDSTVAASASITAAKEIALKEMELRQQMLDRQIQAAHESPSGASAAGIGAERGGTARPLQPENTTRHLILDTNVRKVWVYRIVGSGLEPAGPVAAVSAPIAVNKYVPEARPTFQGITWFGPINVQLIDNEFHLHSTEIRADVDKKFFQFFTDKKAVKPLAPDQTEQLRNKFRFNPATCLFSVKLVDLKDANVRSVSFNKSK